MSNLKETLNKDSNETRKARNLADAGNRGRECHSCTYS